MGICPVCKTREIGPRALMCEPCGRKQNREYYISIGICPRCRKEKLYNGEKNCIECKAKNTETVLKGQYSHIEKIRARDREGKKRRYENRKASGVCVKCGRRKAPKNHVTCEVCRISRRIKNVADIPRSERVSYGLCYRCGKPLDREGRSCKKCAEISAKTLERNRPRRNETWARSNDLLFK